MDHDDPCRLLNRLLAFVAGPIACSQSPWCRRAPTLLFEVLSGLVEIFYQALQPALRCKFSSATCAAKVGPP
jgi:hypothetical protein